MRAGGRLRVAEATIAAAVLVAAGVVLTHGGWAGLAVGLAGLACLGATLVLMAARRAERIAIELALYNLDQARRAAAVAEELRSELERLQGEVARLAAYADLRWFS